METDLPTLIEKLNTIVTDSRGTNIISQVINTLNILDQDLNCTTYNLEDLDQVINHLEAIIMVSRALDQIQEHLPFLESPIKQVIGKDSLADITVNLELLRFALGKLPTYNT